MWEQHQLGTHNFMESLASSSGEKSLCTFVDAWKHPLVNKTGNAIDPCFLSSVISGVLLVFIVSTMYESSRLLWFNYFGPFKIKYSFGSCFNVKSVGGINLMKYHFVFIQCLLSLSVLCFDFESLTDLKTQALLIQSATLIVGAAPLHIIETTRSLVGSGSLLTFWLFHSVSTLINLIQDTFSPHKIFIPDTNKSIQTTIHVIEILLFINACVIFVLESSFYRPAVELVEYYDLNEWNASSVRNLFDRMFFVYLNETIMKAKEEDKITTKQLPHYGVELDNQVAYDTFLRYWNQSVASWKPKHDKLLASGNATDKAVKDSSPSLFIPVFKLTLPFFLRTLFFDLLEFAALIIQPYLLKYFLLFATNRYNAKSVDPELTQQPAIVGFSIATTVFILSLVRYLALNRNYFNSISLGDIIRTAVSSHIYNKGMKLSPKEKKNKPVGELINNLSQDVSTLQNSPDVIIDILVQPVRLIFYMVTVYNFLGFAALAGLASALVLIPIASACFTFVYKEIKVRMKYKDERAKVMTEVLTSIKSIKLYSWEKPMLEKIFEIRNGKELALLRKLGAIRTVITFLWNSIPVAISITSFITAAYVGKVHLTPDVIFPSLSIFDSLSQPILRVPMIFQQIATAKVSLERLSKLFVMEELEVEQLDRKFGPVKKGEESVEIKNATFLWTKDSEDEKKLGMLSANKVVQDEENIESSEPEIDPVALKDINFSAKKGEMACIVGRVGSGKSTLLKAILGCIPVDDENFNPTLKVNGTIAYCAQNAWILNSTVRENILFGRRFNKSFYEATIEACELTKDLDILPDGDNTVVGEKGISLSGGQKARISLARAVYSKADIYILDDILSAVDTHVGKSIIKNVLSKTGLLKNKTVILATNSVPVLHEADNIVLLEKGQITERGTFEEVMKKDTQLAKLIEEFGKQGEDESEKEDKTDVEQDTMVKDTQNEPESSTSEDDQVKDYEPDSMAVLTRVDSTDTTAPSYVSFGHSYDKDFKDDPSKVKKTGHTDEIQYKGKVNLGIYSHYVTACGPLNVFFYLACLLLSVLLVLANTYVLKDWSEQNSESGHNVKIGFFLALYSIVAIGSHLATMISSLVLNCVVAINGSKYFHDTMARSVLRSPMSFFETTPVGRILNRFTEDIGSVDTQLTWIMSFFFSFGFRALSVFAIVVYNLPFMIIIIAGLLFVYDYFRKLYIPASRELKRLRSANKSPVYSHIQESLNGVDTIYAYNQADRFFYKGLSNLNVLTRVEQANLIVGRWLSMRLQGLSAFVVYCATLLILGSLMSSNPIGPGLVGFMMTYILDVTGTLNAIVRMYAEIENRSVTIERLLEYINLKPEAEMIIEDNRPDPSWPEKGAISFKDYETKYRENLDPVLKDINIDIKPSEKIGIVGRTGAGKSSLTLALFRIIEATKGHIEIDGLDTSKIGLFDLRSKLNIIPQDSQAFDGSIRENLDPFGKHTDEELWRVLDLSHLKQHVETMKTEDNDESKKNDEQKKILTGLDAKVEEGGGNLSAGQKQLMCLARALLNDSRVLILDEATASVDVQTDKIVQDTIRSEFKDKTILTIAHRIDTIMDSDRVLVLDKGMVKEFDSPQELLKNTEGIFYLLCKQGGHI